MGLISDSIGESLQTCIVLIELRSVPHGSCHTYAVLIGNSIVDIASTQVRQIGGLKLTSSNFTLAASV